MAKNKLEILVTAKTDNAVKSLGKLDGVVEDLGDETGQLGGKMTMLDGAMVAVGGMAVNMGMDMLRSIPQMVELGVEAERAQTALEGYAGGALEAEIYTIAVAEAAGGAISELTAMENASKLLAMGLADSTGEAATLTEMAITLGASMGKGPQQAFEEFTLLLANQSKLRLDTFGISATEVTQRMEEMMEAEEGLDSQTAFLNATMEIGAQKLEQLGEAGFTAGTELDEMTAIIDDTKKEFGLLLWEGIMPVLRGLLDFRKANIENNDQALETSETFEDYLRATFDLKDGSVALTREIVEAKRKEWEHYRQLEVTRQQMEKNAKEAEEYTKKLSAIPPYISTTVDVNWRTIYSTYNVQDIQSLAGNPPGFQHGGSFMVGGPSGIDRTPVSFMATRGERVDITPRGGQRGGGTVNFTYAPAFSLGNREEFETIIAPMLRDAIR